MPIFSSLSPESRKFLSLTACEIEYNGLIQLLALFVEHKRWQDVGRAGLGTLKESLYATSTQKTLSQVKIRCEVEAEKTFINETIKINNRMNKTKPAEKKARLTTPTYPCTINNDLISCYGTDDIFSYLFWSHRWTTLTQTDLQQSLYTARICVKPSLKKKKNIPYYFK